MLHKDKELLHAYGDQVLEGLDSAMRLVGAKAGWIGIKEKYHDVIDALRPKLPRGPRSPCFATPIRPAMSSSWSMTFWAG